MAVRSLWCEGSIRFACKTKDNKSKEILDKKLTDGVSGYSE
jgi:hypothetical protein